MYKELKALRDSVANGKVLDRIRNDALSKANELAEGEIDKAKSTTSDFSQQTANAIALSMERVLGMGPGTDVLDQLVAEMETNNALVAEGNTQREEVVAGGGNPGAPQG